ncbi:MAG: Gfo/Idh/MocA family oxidoreductase [Paenibacillaceae bacterium]|nr:Gfo/Idh/MocA family oxidoreductase [Paenibacillaceae bacterium]
MGDFAGGETIRIGIIGAGGIARDRHIPNLRRLPGVRLVGAANRTPESAKRAAAEFGLERAYDDWRQLLEDDGIDAVFVCAQPYMHREMTLAALERGKHVFCQARMAMDLADAKRMLEADERTPLTTQLCPAPHYMAVEPYVRELLAEGQLGDIRHVELVHANASLLDPQAPLYWRQRADKQGINLLDVGITAEILNRWFGTVGRLSALTRTWVNDRPADEDGRTAVELADSVTIIGEFAAGAMLTALYTGSVAGGSQRLTIAGSRATLTCFPTEAFVLLNDGGGEKRVDIPAERIGVWRAEAEFVQAIREGRKGNPSMREGIRYMAFSQAVADSLATGKLTELERV